MANPAGGAEELDGVLERTVDDLAWRFHGRFSRETVQQCVHDCYRSLEETARIKQHLPALTHKAAVTELTALADTPAENGQRAGQPVGAASAGR